MAYFVFLVAWFVGGTLIGVALGYLMKQARTKQAVAEMRPPLKELLERAQREVDARNGIRR